MLINLKKQEKFEHTYEAYVSKKEKIITQSSKILQYL